MFIHYLLLFIVMYLAYCLCYITIISLKKLHDTKVKKKQERSVRTIVEDINRITAEYENKADHYVTMEELESCVDKKNK